MRNKPFHVYETTIDRGGKDVDIRVEFNYLPGYPAVYHLKNGDPGYPAEPPDVDIYFVADFEGKNVELTDDELERIVPECIISAQEFLRECADMEMEYDDSLYEDVDDDRE